MGTAQQDIQDSGDIEELGAGRRGNLRVDYAFGLRKREGVRD
jgi:hypothetical protein